MFGGVKFSDCKAAASEEEVRSVERACKLSFPDGLRRLFLEANGGKPDPVLYDYGGLCIVVQRTLVLKAVGMVYSATLAYQQLTQRVLVPTSWFPFAIDPGGNVLLADCSSPEGMVYVCRTDAARKRSAPLNVGIDEFWTHMRPDT
jgi:hypothetical protein